MLGDVLSSSRVYLCFQLSPLALIDANTDIKLLVNSWRGTISFLSSELTKPKTLGEHYIL